MHIDGFVIVPPLNPWDKNNKDIVPHMSYDTFGLTATEAWARHAQIQPSDDDFSRKMQAWHDKGYRLRNARLTIYDEEGNRN